MATDIAEMKKEHNHEHENRQFEVFVSYNGVRREIEVRWEDTVRQVLERAIAAFGNLPQPHMLALYTASGELDDALTVKQSGIRKHEELLLRPSAVKGGRQ